MKREDKKKIVKNLRERVARARLAVITEYRGLNVSKMNDLRSELRKAEVEYQVVKNTLLTQAAKGTELEVLEDQFFGPNAVVLAYDDPVEPAKVLTKFAKDNDKLVIKAGVLRGKALSPDDLVELSKLPSREVLLGQVLGAMNAVPTNLVRAMADAPRRMLNVLNARKDEMEQAA